MATMDDEIKFNPFNYKALTFMGMLAQMNAHPLFKDKPQWLKVLLAGRQDIIASYIDARAVDSIFPTMYTKKNVFEWAKILDYVPRSAACAIGAVRVTLDSNTTLPKVIEKAKLKFQTSEVVGGAPVTFSALADFTFTALTGDIPVKEGEEYSEEQAYQTTGEAFEEFIVVRPNMIIGSASMLINGQLWTEVDTLIDSKDDDRHFRIIHFYDKTMKIRGGDGEYGMRFPVGFQPLLTAWFGGGTRGNVGAGKVDRYIGTDSSIISVTNIMPMSGGQGEESIDHIKMYAPLSTLSQRRAVTASDFKTLSETFPGVVRAFVQPNEIGLLSVQVQIIPNGGGIVAEALKNDLSVYLKSRTLLSNIFVFVVSAAYYPVNVSAELQVTDGYIFEDVKNYVELGLKLVTHEILKELKEVEKSEGIAATIQYINTIFSYTFDSASTPVQSQISRILAKLEPLEWEQDVYVSKYYDVVGVIDGVDFITLLTPVVNVPIPEKYIASSGVVDIVQADLPIRTCTVGMSITAECFGSISFEQSLVLAMGVITSCDGEVS